MVDVKRSETLLSECSSRYYIVKVSGVPSMVPVSPSGLIKGPEAHMFVVDGGSFVTRRQAEATARELAAASPGNRYYVTKAVSGFCGAARTVTKVVVDVDYKEYV